MAPPFSFVLPHENGSADFLTQEELGPLINQAKRHASPLISQSPMVAIGRGSSGRTFIGVNVELPGLPLNHTIHAEQFLLANLAFNSEPKLNGLCISSDGSCFHAPCGHCCQFLQETRVAPETFIFIMDPSSGRGKFIPLASFLPQAPFVRDDGVPRLLDECHNGLTLMDRTSARGMICADPQVPCNHLTCRALAAANRAYAPYSGCPSGVALLDSQGKVYSGWCMESVAHNPSLGPVQAALVDFVANGGGQDFKAIVKAVPVETKSAVASQEATAKMILKIIADPSCTVTVLNCN